MRAISFEYDDRLGLVAFLSFDMYTLVARSWVVWQSVGSAIEAHAYSVLCGRLVVAPNWWCICI